jgi:nicotinamidase-related amidase
MPVRNRDLHGNVPDNATAALLIIDVINDLEFPGGELLARYVMPMAQRILRLKQRAKAAGIPTIYVNDNFGRWQSDLSKLLAHCLEPGVRGRAMVDLLRPEEDDYFVLKPKHSAFYSTTLDTLLDYLGARTLMLTGLAGNICLLFSANDAYMRDFQLYLPADCTVSNEPEDNEHALALMSSVLKADTTVSDQLDLTQLGLALNHDASPDLESATNVRTA